MSATKRFILHLQTSRDPGLCTGPLAFSCVAENSRAQGNALLQGVFINYKASYQSPIALAERSEERAIIIPQTVLISYSRHEKFIEGLNYASESAILGREMDSKETNI